jgi:hypothetical protein
LDVSARTSTSKILPKGKTKLAMGVTHYHLTHINECVFGLSSQL